VVVGELTLDGLSPGRVEEPGTPEELAEALAAAAQRGDAVVPVGGGHALHLGNVPERFDVALRTGGVDRILHLSQADLTMSVEAGTRLDAIDEALRPLGQQLPLDPIGGGGHTIGGVLAAGLFGPMRERYGTPRDFLVGLRVALPDGRLVASGGRVVKNVSGYDMNKLHLGALGTLGVIVAASFKLFPRPAREVYLEVRSNDAWREVERALALPERPVAVEIDDGGTVRARLGGTESAVTRLAGELGWEEVSPGPWSTQTSDDPVLARLTAPPRRLRQVLETLPAGARWWAWPGIGVAHWMGAGEAADIISVRASAEQAGGALVLLSGPTRLRRDVGAWGTPPGTLEWMRRLRSSFDPTHTISPGRFLV
jgi:glycolate oxidase FAD binding subunit